MTHPQAAERQMTAAPRLRCCTSVGTWPVARQVAQSGALTITLTIPAVTSCFTGFKRAFGASASFALHSTGPRAAGGAGAPSSRTPPARGLGHAAKAPGPAEPDALQLRHRHRLVTVRLATHLRATDPIDKDLHDGARPQGRFASLRMLRDGLRPPLPTDTDEQEGWLSGRWLSRGRPRVASKS
jgi:hypothetical protein